MFPILSIQSISKPRRTVGSPKLKWRYVLKFDIQQYLPNCGISKMYLSLLCNLYAKNLEWLFWLKFGIMLFSIEFRLHMYHDLVVELYLIIIYYFFDIYRCCSLFVPCWRTQIPMILWFLKLPTCTRQTGTNMSQLQEAGPRNMPWANMVCVRESHFYLKCLGLTDFVWKIVVFNISMC
jgi:hypothetical protein